MVGDDAHIVPLKCQDLNRSTNARQGHKNSIKQYYAFCVSRFSTRADGIRPYHKAILIFRRGRYYLPDNIPKPKHI